MNLIFRDRLVRHLLILESVNAEADILGLTDDHVFDRAEFLLLGEREMLTGLVLVVALQLIPQFVPCLIAGRHLQLPAQFIHDAVHDLLDVLWQIAVLLFALY